MDDEDDEEADSEEMADIQAASPVRFWLIFSHSTYSHMIVLIFMKTYSAEEKPSKAWAQEGRGKEAKGRRFWKRDTSQKGQSRQKRQEKFV